MAIAPDFDETLAGSYTPDKDGSSRDKMWSRRWSRVEIKFYGVVLHAIGRDIRSMAW